MQASGWRIRRVARLVSNPREAITSLAPTYSSTLPSLPPSFSGALGFACAENIMYAFSGGTSLGPSPLGGSSSNKLSMFVDEISVLTLRALMPVHVICAALQAIQWVKVSPLLPPYLP